VGDTASGPIRLLFNVLMIVAAMVAIALAVPRGDSGVGR
jgi:hypothetical protein